MAAVLSQTVLINTTRTKCHRVIHHNPKPRLLQCYTAYTPDLWRRGSDDKCRVSGKGNWLNFISSIGDEYQHDILNLYICVIGAGWVSNEVSHCGKFSSQGLYSLSGRTSYRKISWSIEATRFGFRLFQSLRNLTGTSAAVLPRCLSNFRAIR